MKLKPGQLRRWVAKDEDGNLEDPVGGPYLFLVVSDPFIPEDLYTEYVAILEDDEIIELGAEHVENWSEVVKWIGASDGTE